MLYIYTLYFSYGRRCSRVCETEKIEKQALKLFFIYQNTFLFFYNIMIFYTPGRAGWAPATGRQVKGKWTALAVTVARYQESQHLGVPY